MKNQARRLQTVEEEDGQTDLEKGSPKTPPAAGACNASQLPLSKQHDDAAPLAQPDSNAWFGLMAIQTTLASLQTELASLSSQFPQSNADQPLLVSPQTPRQPATIPPPMKSKTNVTLDAKTIQPHPLPRMSAMERRRIALANHRPTDTTIGTIDAWRCPCGQENGIRSNYCGFCGTSKTKVLWKCFECGFSANQKTFRFCVECGAEEAKSPFSVMKKRMGVHATKVAVAKIDRGFAAARGETTEGEESNTKSTLSCCCCPNLICCASKKSSSCCSCPGLLCWMLLFVAGCLGLGYYGYDYAYDYFFDELVPMPYTFPPTPYWTPPPKKEDTVPPIPATWPPRRTDAPTPTPAPTIPEFRYFNDSCLVWGEEGERQEGFVNLVIANLPERILKKEPHVLALLWEDVYNNVTNATDCNSTYSRVMQGVSLTGFNMVFGTDVIMGGIVPTTYAWTEWLAAVACHGCPAEEPLFSNPPPDIEVEDMLEDDGLLEVEERKGSLDNLLEDVDDMSLFEIFCDRFIDEINALFPSLKEPVRLVYGSALDETNRAVMEYDPLKGITGEPSAHPSASPTRAPSAQPTSSPSKRPTISPSSRPSYAPSVSPSSRPTRQPSDKPSRSPSDSPSDYPSELPTASPSARPTRSPSASPSALPSSSPSGRPSRSPSDSPSDFPSEVPSAVPSRLPSSSPSSRPSNVPSSTPSDHPSRTPSAKPSALPSQIPSDAPSHLPSDQPSKLPSSRPSDFPSVMPSNAPSELPSESPSDSSAPSTSPSPVPSVSPTFTPETCFAVCNQFLKDLSCTQCCLKCEFGCWQCAPIYADSIGTKKPSLAPTPYPTAKPPATRSPTLFPTKNPTTPNPTVPPTTPNPTVSPTAKPSPSDPSVCPTMYPATPNPTVAPTNSPDPKPSLTVPSTAKPEMIDPPTSPTASSTNPTREPTWKESSPVDTPSLPNSGPAPVIPLSSSSSAVSINPAPPVQSSASSSSTISINLAPATVPTTTTPLSSSSSATVSVNLPIQTSSSSTQSAVASPSDSPFPMPVTVPPAPASAARPPTLPPIRSPYGQTRRPTPAPRKATRALASSNQTSTASPSNTTPLAAALRLLRLLLANSGLE